MTADGEPWADHAERIALAASAGLLGEQTRRRSRVSGHDSPSNMPRVARERRLPREFVRTFSCPSCGAVPQQLCVDKNGEPRERNHPARVAVARASVTKRSAAPATVQLWAAGACPQGPGPGRWSSLLCLGKRELELHGSAPFTTENRMNLTSVIEGLRLLTARGRRVKVHIQSEYVVHAFTKGWLSRWQRDGWMNQAGEAVKNRDLWELLAAEAGRHQIQWVLVNGPGGPPHERVLTSASAQR